MKKGIGKSRCLFSLMWSVECGVWSVELRLAREVREQTDTATEGRLSLISFRSSLFTDFLRLQNVCKMLHFFFLRGFVI